MIAILKGRSRDMCGSGVGEIGAHNPQTLCFETNVIVKCYCHNVILTKTIYAQSLFSRDNLKLFVSWHFLNILILQLTQTSLTQPHLFNIKCYNGLNWLSNFLFLTYSPLTVSLEVQHTYKTASLSLLM